MEAYRSTRTFASGDPDVLVGVSGMWQNPTAGNGIPVACYMKIYQGWRKHDGDHNCDENALMRWLGMVGKAL